MSRVMAGIALYRNNADGTFIDVTRKLGVAAGAGPRALAGLITTATADLTCSSDDMLKGLRSGLDLLW